MSSVSAEKKEILNAGSIKRRSNRVLVTGGAGFIGSHLIDALLKDERNEVICLDNLYSGQKSNVWHHMGNPRFEFLRHDVTTPIQLEVDQIYHLACPASPVFYQNDGIKTIETNVMGTMNMLHLANRVKARFLISSTSEVYGDPDVHPQVEEYWGNVNNIGIRRSIRFLSSLFSLLCSFLFQFLFSSFLFLFLLLAFHHTRKHTHFLLSTHYFPLYRVLR